ncbi:MAG: hypothetical protein P8X54_07905 [Desulfuromonadales bacterium]|jgi:uncharacterized protein
MISWEDICRRCGLCCFEKSVDKSGRFTTTRTPCQHLDIVSRECRVYHKRLEVGEGCVKLTPQIVSQADWLPESCAYRESPGRGTRDATREKT